MNTWQLLIWSGQQVWLGFTKKAVSLSYVAEDGSHFLIWEYIIPILYAIGILHLKRKQIKIKSKIG